MKTKNIFALLAALATLTFSSCNNEDKKDEPVVSNEMTISSNITSSTTWETGKTYILAGRIAVTSGATLTIQAGAVIKGKAGTGTNATALLIAQGGKLVANGTSSNPIIFTSYADDLEPGDIESPNLDPDLNGLWGGVIVLGKAHISPKGSTETYQIEGIPADDENGKYGGTADDDNSGVIKYISIRHGGANIGEGNEINGLTLGGVGSSTVIDGVEIVSNQDDGIEWFGGTVNLTNVLVWNVGDDAIDCDQAWNGTLDNFIVINPGDECFELDGPEGTYVNGNYTIKNGSVKAHSAEGLVDNDPETNVDMDKIYFFDIEGGQDFDEMPTVASSITNIEVTMDSLTIADYFKGTSAANVTSVAAGANTVGANVSNFIGWTWADSYGALTDF